MATKVNVRLEPRRVGNRTWWAVIINDNMVYQGTSVTGLIEIAELIIAVCRATLEENPAIR